MAWSADRKGKRGPEQSRVFRGVSEGFSRDWIRKESRKESRKGEKRRTIGLLCVSKHMAVSHTGRCTSIEVVPSRSQTEQVNNVSKATNDISIYCLHQ